MARVRARLAAGRGERGEDGRQPYGGRARRTGGWFVSDCVSAHRTEALAEQLAGWAAVVEVTGPRSVRRALRDLGKRIAVQYADPDAGEG